jgi:hypothetical protein
MPTTGASSGAAGGSNRLWEKRRGLLETGDGSLRQAIYKWTRIVVGCALLFFGTIAAGVRLWKVLNPVERWNWNGDDFGFPTLTEGIIFTLIYLSVAGFGLWVLAGSKEGNISN